MRCEIKRINDPEYRYEVWAPSGYNFGSEHSILATTKTIADEIARDHEACLEPCPDDCDCKSAESE